MMWAFLSIAICELAVVHFLIALWSSVAALVVSLVSVPLLIWLIRGIASLRSMPSTIADGLVTLRAGRMRCAAVPLSQVAGWREAFAAAEAKAPDVLNLALIAHPNVMIDLAQPIVRGKRVYNRLAHRLDDPAAFVAALVRLGDGGDRP